MYTFSVHTLLLKKQAILLRKSGKTYREILCEIPVAKSTLSEWFREVHLSIPQKQRITRLKKLAQMKGALAQHTKRKNHQLAIYTKSKLEIGVISDRELWLIGITLYWAEGSKEKEYSPGSPTVFANSDVRMISLYMQWLRRCIGISDTDITVSLYIHESHKYRIEEVIRFWSVATAFSITKFTKIYFKKHNIKTNRKNTGNLYNGLLRVTISSSSTLNRQITGWTQGIVENCGLV